MNNIFFKFRCVNEPFDDQLNRHLHLKARANHVDNEFANFVKDLGK